MKVPFRQGLIGYQVDGFGVPQFLIPSATPGYVALNVSPTPCTVTFAHGSSDYLQVFASDVPAAWGPIPAGVSYLYWDIDLFTANVTFGFTTLEPVVGPTAPPSPPAPSGNAVFHWFDTSTTTMKVWKGSVWQNVVRAFAGRVNGTISNITAEPKGVSWRGAVPTEGRPGYISTDIFGNPLRTLGGEFVTTSSPIRIRNTVGTSGVLAVLPNAFVPVRATQSIPAMSLVYFSGAGTVGLASGNPAIVPARIPIGIVQDELNINEVGVLTQSGEISYDQWDWSAHIGKPLYCGDNGEIVTNRPVGLMAYRVGFVKDAKTILFQVDAETMPQVYQAAASDIIIAGTSPVSTAVIINGLGERVWTVSMPAATPSNPGFMTAAQATELTQFDTRLDNAEAAILNRALLTHSHVIANVSGLQAALDGKAPLVHNHDSTYSPLGHNHDGYHAPVVHSHTIPDVAGLQTALNAKSNVGHVHPIAEVTGLQTALDTKIDRPPTFGLGNFARFNSFGNVEDSGANASTFAFANHTHGIAQVTGLQVALDSKAALVHGHAISDVTGLQAALNAKSDVVHVHSMDSLTDADTSTVPPTVGQVLSWNGTNWVPQAVTVTPSINSITIELGSAVLFTLRPSAASMQYFSAYQAMYPTVQGFGGTFRTSPVPGMSVVAPLEASVAVTGNQTFMTTVDVGPTAGPPVAAEIVVGYAPQAGTAYYVGYWDLGFTPGPLDINQPFGNSPLATYFISMATSSETAGYGGIGSFTGLPAWTPGVVIGMVRHAGGVDFFRDGVHVATCAVVDGNDSYFFCGMLFGI